MNADPISIRRESLKWLNEHSVSIHPHLPLLEINKLRSPRDVAQRIVALYCMAGIANGADSAMLLDWLKADGRIDCLESSEIATLRQSTHSDERLNELSWMQESLYTLCWCSAVVEDLPFPDRECDLSRAFPKIPPERDFEDFAASIMLRDQYTLFQALDCYYNLHAALVHPELWNGPDRKLIPLLQIVLERRHALEWICSPLGPWRDVVLDT